MLETVKFGDSGNLVKVAQCLIGYSEMKKATGKFDDDFSDYVSEWQSENGLTVAKEIGEPDWTKILENLPTCSTSKNNKSAYVCALQILLGGLTVDGIFGINTKKAVAAYQSASGLSVDGICGSKTWKSLIVGGKELTPVPEGSSQTVENGKVINKCVHYLQWDSKWKNVKYSTHTSSQTIGNSGCGPSSMAMIMATFIDKSITPVEMCALAVKGGFRTENNGTSWGFYEYVYNHYDGFSKFIDTTSVEILKAGLKEGALAVCSMNSNDGNFWTKGGHFIVAVGYDSDGYIYANDPNKEVVPRKQKQNKFQSCLKHAFLFWPEKKSEQLVNKDEEASKKQTSGDKIIDISKHQGTINWDKFSENLAVVFIKASGLYKNGADTQYANNVAGAVSHNVPFHVYHFLYCLTEEEAKRDAALFYNTVKSQKHMPLSWCLDCEAEWGVPDKKAKTVANAFEAELRRLAGDDIKVGVYIGHNKYNDYNLDYDHYDYVWIPRYGSNDGTIEGSIKPSYPCDLWQYTSLGKVPGVSGNVDMNVIIGQGKDLSWFTGSIVTPTPESAPVAPVTGKSVRIVGGNCNVRTTSNTSGSIIGIAFEGEVFPYAGLTASNGWQFINYNGKNAWVSGKYGKLI